MLRKFSCKWAFISIEKKWNVTCSHILTFYKTLSGNWHVCVFGLCSIRFRLNYDLIMWCIGTWQGSSCWASGENILQTRRSESSNCNLWGALPWSQWRHQTGHCYDSFVAVIHYIDYSFTLIKFAILLFE